MKIRQVLSCLLLLTSCALEAAQVMATNEHCQTVINVTCIEAAQVVSLSERLAKVEASCAEMRASVDGLMSAIESRHQCEDKREDEIARRIEQASEKAEKYYEKRYGELKHDNECFSDYANRWMTIMGSIVGAASLVATILSVLFGCVLPRIDMRTHNKRIDAMARRMAKMEEEAIAERTSWKVEARGQKRWTLALIIQSVDTFSLATPINRQRLADDLACFMLQFYQLIDGCVRDGNADIVEEEVSHCAPFMKRWLAVANPDLMNIFDTACIGVRKKIRPDRVVYETLLRKNGESFALLARLSKKTGG